MQVAPNQISPGENFDIFYFLRNQTDSTTYYIQAKVYDVRTWEVLQTVNLTQATTNSRLFTKTIQAPADSSGYGRNIVAIATVYTDSGYTVKSTDYEEQEQYFLVKVLLPNIGGGGVDYRVVRDIIQEELGKLPKPFQPKDVTIPDMPFESLFGAIGALQREVNRIPKDSVDLSGVTSSLDTLHGLVNGLPDPETVELQPIMDALDELRGLIADVQSDVDEIQVTQPDLIDGAVNKATTAMAKELMKTVTNAIAAQEITIPLKGMVSSVKPEQPQPMDLSHLM